MYRADDGHFRFWILDFGFWIYDSCTERSRSIGFWILDLVLSASRSIGFLIYDLRFLIYDFCSERTLCAIGGVGFTTLD